MNSTPTDNAARIRSVLRKQGITNKQVSIRTARGSTIYIKIHDPCVDIREVQNISASSEKVRYDEYTGEILQGGNRFVFVEYSDAAAKKFAEINSDLIAALIKTDETSTANSTTMVGEWGLWKNPVGGMWRILTKTGTGMHRYVTLDPVAIAGSMLDSRDMK